MSSAFLSAFGEMFRLRPFSDKDSYTCNCGIRLGISVDNISAGNPILKNPSVLRDAHLKHHNEHYGHSATLYMIGESTPPGNDEIVAALCSCEWKKEHPDD